MRCQHVNHRDGDAASFRNERTFVYPRLRSPRPPMRPLFDRENDCFVLKFCGTMEKKHLLTLNRLISGGDSPGARGNDIRRAKLQ
jgi:hypothetical protein